MANDNETEKVIKKNIKPYSAYIIIWLALLALTGATVTAAGLNFGALSVLGAIVIATVKSSLVVYYFMNIKYEDRIFKIMLGAAIATLAIIMILTFVDVSFQ